MISTCEAIPTRHKDTWHTSQLKGLEDVTHASMVEVGNLTTAGGFVRDKLEPCCRKICEKNVGLFRWFSTNFFGDVANCEIERVCALVLKQVQLCFITWKNDRHNCCTWFVYLKLFLNKSVGCVLMSWCLEQMIDMRYVKLTCVDHHHLPVCISWYMREVLFSST